MADEPSEESFRDRTGLSDTSPVQELPPETQVRIDDLKQLTRLKRIYGFWILGLMGGQLIVVNTGFLLYAGLGHDWAPPTGAIQVWLAATFVQIVSVVVVITRSLFPNERPAPGG